MTIFILKTAGMLVLAIGFWGMLGADRSHSVRTTLLFRLTEYWGFGYVALYVTNWWRSASTMDLPELLTMFILLPVAYGVVFWIAGIFVKEMTLRSFW